jgi:tetratricopeptide (TPR) repeat protein
VSPARICLGILALVLLHSATFAAAPPAGPLPSQIAGWIADLGDDEFATRQSASRKLRAAGEAAEAALQKAADSRDIEVRKRARAILADFRWGIYPSTPGAVVELIRKYQGSAKSEKAGVIRQLIALGPAGCKALVKIASAESDPLTRKDVFADLFAGIAKMIPALLESDQMSALEGVLELAIRGDIRRGIGHYAAYHLLKGSLPERIRVLEATVKSKVVAKEEQEILAYLYRARGDLTRAINAAREAERNDLVEALLYEKTDWKELARQPNLVDNVFWPRQAGYRAAYARLSGDEKALDAIVKDIIERARPIAENKGDVRTFAKALLMNGRSADAIALLDKSGTRPKLLYDLLVTQLKMEQAFALVVKVRKEMPDQMPVLELAQVRTLHLLGAKDEAFKILKRYTDDIKAGREVPWAAEVVAAELAIGRKEEAFARAKEILGKVNDPATSARVFEKLFDDDATDAALLWLLVRHPQAKVARKDALDALRRLMEGKSSAEEIDNLMNAARDQTPEQWRVLGDAAVRAKQEAKAAECFRKAGTVRASIRLGDLEAGHKRWTKAAELYRAAYRLGLKQLEKERRRTDDGEGLPALALFLHGHALVQAGKQAEGNRLISQAHLLPLGDGEMRYELMRALVRRGHQRDGHCEQELLRRLGQPILLDPDSYYTGEGLRAAALNASARKDWLKASDGFEQAFLRILHPDMNFARAQAYITVPAHSFRLRAMGYAAAGKLDEASRESRRAQAAMPGHIDLAIHLVPIFEARGRKKEAAELFQSAAAPYEGLVRAYPKCAWAFNQMAWLSACCKRDLDKGLLHARKAVALEPTSGAYHDTLAEVLFQLGKKDEAIAMQKKAIALNPKREYFRKQLKRIEAGDPKAARPVEDDD